MNSCNCASCMLKRPRNNRRIVGETNTHDTPGPPSGVGSMRASSNDSFLFIGDRVCAYMCVCWCGGWGTPWIWNGEISFPKAKATTNNTTDSGHNMTGGVAGWGVGGGGVNLRRLEVKQVHNTSPSTTKKTPAGCLCQNTFCSFFSDRAETCSVITRC